MSKSLTTQEHTAEPFTDSAILRLHERISKGYTTARVARELAPNSRSKQKYWRQRLRKAMNDPRMQILIHEDAHATATAALPRAIRGAAAQAARGRMDAVKFIAEVTRFHTPRTQHEHSGDIRITIDMPRPRRVQNEEDIPDADVVEE
jgi:hypothetical protein